MITETSRIIDELNRAIHGDPWHGRSVADILDGVSAAQASLQPVPGVHTIWEIVRHMTAWTHEVTHRLAGHPAGDPAEGDWPQPSGVDERAWAHDVQAFFEAHGRLVASLESLADSALREPTRDPRSGETGTGVTRDVLLHGLAQHHAYHAGQIALLRRAGPI
jgi:uncharacterized damage-inducible protein DinB